MVVAARALLEINDNLCPGQLWWRAQVQPKSVCAQGSREFCCSQAPSLHEGLKHLERLRHQSSHDLRSDARSFHVTVAMMSGQTKQILGLKPGDRLCQLTAKIAAEFGIPADEVQVSMDEAFLDAGNLRRRLHSLGIHKGLTLTCVRSKGAANSEELELQASVPA
eukprot:CAMPEP_0197620664 /NCGR_PEP_ID=MMETSP1338-20131121/1458_1 /TAXON_ID=43686 ORGANISM="Pelagodinium beii, Strain RCC1491" /NCGR_SAMPLE_ID=MMETSP1338 /ASSEMBLY_ACC=CAM_ASM_000754 /LENGTH=164 /DNA_ID=CAMNT_0043189917 /DNA_START=51 /DNA_END=545 /DNA_ORIENTATION=-